MLKYLFLFAFIAGCGDINVQQKEPKDKDVTIGGEEDSATTDETASDDKSDAPKKNGGRPKPALTSPDECGGEYKAKMVYDDGEQKLYACVRDGSGGGSEDAGEPKELEVLEGCPYTAEVQADRSLVLTYVAPATEKNPIVFPSYTIPKNIRGFDIPLMDGGGQTAACWASYWDGQSLEYTDAKRMRQYTATP